MSPGFSCSDYINASYVDVSSLSVSCIHAVNVFCSKSNVSNSPSISLIGLPAETSVYSDSRPPPVNGG